MQLTHPRGGKLGLGEDEEDFPRLNLASWAACPIWWNLVFQRSGESQIRTQSIERSEHSYLTLNVCINPESRFEDPNLLIRSVEMSFGFVSAG